MQSILQDFSTLISDRKNKKAGIIKGLTVCGKSFYYAAYVLYISSWVSTIRQRQNNDWIAEMTESVI